MSTTLLILLAFVPGLLIALFIYLRDMREPEPYSLLLMLSLIHILGSRQYSDGSIQLAIGSGQAMCVGKILWKLVAGS